MSHRPAPPRWTHAHARLLLLLAATVVMLLTVDALVDVIHQNMARGEQLRASMALPRHAALPAALPSAESPLASADLTHIHQELP